MIAWIVYIMIWVGWLANRSQTGVELPVWYYFLLLILSLAMLCDDEDDDE